MNCYNKLMIIFPTNLYEQFRNAIFSLAAVGKILCFSYLSMCVWPVARLVKVRLCVLSVVVLLPVPATSRYKTFRSRASKVRACSEVECTAYRMRRGLKLVIRPHRTSAGRSIRGVVRLSLTYHRV